MKSKRTREFRARFDALLLRVQSQAIKAYLQVRTDPNHLSLNFKPVGGELVWYWVRIGISYRAVCVRGGRQLYVILDRLPRGLRHLAKTPVTHR